MNGSDAVSRAAVEVSRYYRLRGALTHLRALVRIRGASTRDDHRHFFMVWQTVHVLDPLAPGLARPQALPPVPTR